MQINETIQAGGFLTYNEQNDFFRILAAGSPLTVIFYRNGAEVAQAENVGSGYSEKFSQSFDKVILRSAVSNAVSIVMRLGNEVTYDQPPNGAVNGSFHQTQKTVTPVSTTLLNANTGRRYLLIQNKDAAGDIFVRLDGVPATEANGLKIESGGSLELVSFVATGEITAVGSIASNPNVIAIQG